MQNSPPVGHPYIYGWPESRPTAFRNTRPYESQFAADSCSQNAHRNSRTRGNTGHHQVPNAMKRKDWPSLDCAHNAKVGGSNPPHAIRAAPKRPFFIALRSILESPSLWWSTTKPFGGHLVDKIASASTSPARSIWRHSCAYKCSPLSISVCDPFAPATVSDHRSAR